MSLSFNTTGVRYRREPFGGLVYNKVKGYTIEVNHTTQLFLELVAETSMDVQAATHALASHFNVPVARVRDDFEHVIMRLAEFNVLIEARDGQPGATARREPVEVLLDPFPEQVVQNGLNVPEVLHLAITAKCPMRCPACYVDAGTPSGREIPTSEIFTLVDIMDRERVFQLGLGGGEALVHPDLVDIIARATSRDITVAITTSGVNLTPEMASDFKQAGIKQVQISHDGVSKEVFEQTRSKGSFEIAKEAIKNLKHAGIEFGFNVLVTPSVLKELPALVRYAESEGAVELILLRPKPSGRQDQDGWFEKNKLSFDHQAWLIRFLSHLHTRLRIRTDTSFCQLYYFVDPKRLQDNGVFGCTAARRFCSISSDGSMFPCSHFFQFPEFNGGRCIELMDNWRNAPAFERFRTYETGLEDPCKTCSIMPYCKGCRKVAVHETGSFHGLDPYCLKMDPR